MKLNKIQQRIYNEYKFKGSVWADCPRQCGKTELLLNIAEEEIKCKHKVYISSFSCNNTKRIINLLKDRLREHPIQLKKYLVTDEYSADVILYDEIYYDVMNHRNNKNVVCLRTRLHPTLAFTYLDLESDIKKNVSGLKKHMSKEQWNIEFNNGNNGFKE